MFLIITAIEIFLHVSVREPFVVAKHNFNLEVNDHKDMLFNILLVF